MSTNATTLPLRGPLAGGADASRDGSRDWSDRILRVIGGALLVGLVAIALLIVVIAADRPSFLAPTTNNQFFPRWLAGPLGGMVPELTQNRNVLKYVFTFAIAGMYLCYLLALICVPRMRARWAIAAVVAVHLVFLLSPPLSLTDIFNYINYGRMEVVHHLNPYNTVPAVEPHSDPSFDLSNWHHLLSPYGPLFTILTFALVPLGIAASFWTLKVILMVASLGTLFLLWRCAELLGRDPLHALVFVGLNPLVLVWGLGGDHNDFIMMFFIMLGIYLLLRARAARAGAHAEPGSVGERAGDSGTPTRPATGVSPGEARLPGAAGPPLITAAVASGDAAPMAAATPPAPSDTSRPTLPVTLRRALSSALGGAAAQRDDLGPTALVGSPETLPLAGAVNGTSTAGDSNGANAAVNGGGGETSSTAPAVQVANGGAWPATRAGGAVVAPPNGGGADGADPQATEALAPIDVPIAEPSPGAGRRASGLPARLRSSLLALSALEVAGGAALIVAISIKASAGILVPVVLLGLLRSPRRVIGVLIGMALAAIVLATVSFVAFGSYIPDLTTQAKLVTAVGLPNLLGLALGQGGETTTLHSVLSLVLVASVLGASLWAWRRREWITPAGWATVALVVTLSWVLPWYVLWMLPLAALGRSKLMRGVVLVLGVYLILAWVPLMTGIIHAVGFKPSATPLGQLHQRITKQLLH